MGGSGEGFQRPRAGKASQVDGGDGGGASPCRKAGAEVLAGPLGDGGGERSGGWDPEGFCQKQVEAGQRGVDQCLVELPGADAARLPPRRLAPGRGRGSGGTLLSLGAYHLVQPQEISLGNTP